MSDRQGADLLVKGEVAGGGFHTVWAAASVDATTARHIEFQYADMPHQSETAITGMWLFIATEMLFFGGLFLVYLVIRSKHPAAVADASRHAELLIGSINAVLLVTSSAVFSYGVDCARQGRNRALFWVCVATAVIGCAFLGLKGYEWSDDFGKHLFPGAEFAITGPDEGVAQLFWCFYFIATGLHGVHMIVGIGLVCWIARLASARRFTPLYFTPVEVVGLYWSFVDIVWLLLYPMIYLAGRLGR